MFHRIRFAMAGLGILGVVGVLGFGALRHASVETREGGLLLITCGFLMLAVIGAVCRPPDERPWWLGFAVFGWGYFIMAHWCTYHLTHLPTASLLVDTRAIPPSEFDVLWPSLRIIHMLWTVLIAVCGGMAANLLFGGRAVGGMGIVGDTPIDQGSTRSWWRRPALVGLAGSCVVLTASLATRGSAPEFRAGLTFLLTCGLLGLATLGAILGRGRRREAWIGAAVFGIGYMVLAFGPLTTSRPTAHLLNAIARPVYPTKAVQPADDELTRDAENLRITMALEEPISIHFRDPTPVKEVLAYIKDAMKGHLGRNLTIYADPIEMHMARVNLHLGPGSIVGVKIPMVSIDRENIPAKDALRLCLAPIGLTYRVWAGYVRIVPGAYRPLSVYDDPVMLVGHSLLALIAAAVGGVAAPIVSRLCGRRPLAG